MQRTINKVRNPRWADADQATIICDVDFDELDYEFVPFSCVRNADTTWGQEIWARCNDGEFGPVADYEPPPLEPEPVTILYPADLWRRTTEAEAEQIDAAMREQSLRTRRIFSSAQVYRSDDELWPALTAAAEALFGAERAAELLAASVV